jgi:uncharacterized protein GlcG (DUF336 family)
MHVTIAEAEIAIVSAAEIAIVSARKRAAELETKMCVVIVDSGANLKAFHRMDDAWVGSIDIALNKANPGHRESDRADKSPAPRRCRAAIYYQGAGGLVDIINGL